jgi:signal transduction histidine kinase
MTESQPDTELETLRRRHHLFLRAATHELRTPLQSLQGFVELLSPGLPPAKLERYLGILKRDTSRLIAVVDDLSQRNLLENDQLEIKPVAFSVEQLLVDLSQSLEAYYPDRFVVMKYPPDLPLVYVDPAGLRYVLWALLCNSARYAERSAVSYRPLRVSIRQHGTRLEFSIHDDSPTIPADCREVIFEPLAELPKSVGKRPRFGLGMGLYVAREIARRMGGDLYVEARRKVKKAKPKARKSQGNVFVLTVPVAEIKKSDHA